MKLGESAARIPVMPDQYAGEGDVSVGALRVYLNCAFGGAPSLLRGVIGVNISKIRLGTDRDGKKGPGRAKRGIRPQGPTKVVNDVLVHPVHHRNLCAWLLHARQAAQLPNGPASRLLRGRWIADFPDGSTTLTKASSAFDPLRSVASGSFPAGFLTQ